MPPRARCSLRWCATSGWPTGRSPRGAASARGSGSEATCPWARPELRDGDRLGLGAGGAATVCGGRQRRAALVDLVVVGGPGPGRPCADRGTSTSSAADPAPTWSSPTARCRAATSPYGSAPTGVTVSDLGSSNGTFVEGAPLAGERRIVDGEVLEAGRSADARSSPTRPPAPAAPTVPARSRSIGRRAWRGPRRRTAVELAGSAARGTGARPAPAGRGGRPAGARRRACSPPPAAPTCCSWAGRAGDGALEPLLRATRRARARHREALTAWRRELDEARRLRRRRRATGSSRGAAPRPRTPRSCAPRAGASAPELWERRPADPDFLALRVGVADLPPEAAVDRRAGRRRGAARRGDAATRRGSAVAQRAGHRAAGGRRCRPRRRRAGPSTRSRVGWSPRRPSCTARASSSSRRRRPPARRATGSG